MSKRKPNNGQKKVHNPPNEAVKDKKTAVSTEVAEEATISVAPEPEPPKKELSAIEKVQIMHSLTSAVTDPAVKQILTERDHGEEIYQLFVDAIEKSVSKMMTGDVEETEVVGQMDVAALNLVRSADDLHRLIVNLQATPLVGVLKTLNKNLGGVADSTPLDQEMPTDPKLRAQRIREAQQQYLEQQKQGNGQPPPRRGRGDGTPGL